MPTRTLPLVLLALAGLAGAADAERTLMLCDFETPYDGAKWPPDGAGAVANSSEWKADGASSLRIDAGLTGVFDMTRQGDWRGYDTLRLKFSNPTQQTVAVAFELADQPSKGYWDRHQNGFGVPPGEHTIDLDLSGGLWRSEQNRPFRGEVKTPIELDKITRFMIGNSGAAPIYVDSIQLITVPKLACEGGFAFDFGRKEARVMGQFTGVNKETRYDASRGFGLTGDSWSLNWDMVYPTPMLGDSLNWSAGFRVDLAKAGRHIGIVAFERGGFWGSGEDTAYTKLTFSADGKPVHTHESRRDAIHFAFQDVEVTDAQRIVDDIIFPATGWTRFAFDAEAGGTTFAVATENTVGSGIRVSGLILAPDTAEGRAFLDAHEQLQRSSTFTMFTPQERGRRGEGRAKPAKDLLAAPLILGEDVYPRDWPATAPTKPTEILAVRGQTAAVQLGVYAARDLTVTVEASAPKGPGTLPTPTVSYGRYLPMRGYGSGSVWIQINHLRPEPTFTVGPDLARAVVVEIAIPADAKAGAYAFDVAIAGGGASTTVPVKLRVTAADLATIPIPVGLFSNALSFGPELVDEATWWRLQESLLREQTNAGLTMVTGGSGLGLAVAPDGTITGDAAIRYLKLAKSLGVTAAVAYGGFMPSANDLRGNAAAAAKGVAALEAQGVPKLYVNSYDEPSTPAELAAANAAIAGVTEAGLRTVGWTSAHWDSPEWLKLIAGTHGPAFNLHEPDMYAKVRAMGREPWSYNNGPDRYGYSIHLYRQIKLGCMGRPDWIGNYVQGYAFNNLDGREPADCQFAVHREFGVLRTLAWLRSRQGLTDLRLLLALERKSPEDPILARVNDLSGWRSDQAKWTDADLDRLRAEVLARLDQLGR